MLYLSIKLEVKGYTCGNFFFLKLDVSPAEFCQSFKEELILILLRLLETVKGKAFSQTTSVRTTSL